MAVNQNTNNQAVYNFIQSVKPEVNNGNVGTYSVHIVYYNANTNKIIFSTKRRRKIMIDFQQAYLIRILCKMQPECFIEFHTRFNSFNYNGASLEIRGTSQCPQKPDYVIYLS